MGQREVLAVHAFSVLCSVHQRDSDRKASVKGSILVLTLACRFITRYTNSTNVKFKCHPMKCCRIYYTLPYCDFISIYLELACCNDMSLLVTPGWTSDHCEGGLTMRWPITDTAKELTSRQKEWLHGQKENLTAKRKRLAAKFLRCREDILILLFCR